MYAVVGFDGSGSALRALDAASRLLRGRSGTLEVVYVAHLSAIVSGADLTGRAMAEVRSGLNDVARELSDETRAHLQGTEQRWHFQRRDGVIADELRAAADELRDQHGPEAAVVIVVGRSEHGYHHVMGSVPQALERHDHYPVLVIP